MNITHIYCEMNTTHIYIPLNEFAYNDSVNSKVSDESDCGIVPNYVYT